MPSDTLVSWLKFSSLFVAGTGALFFIATFSQADYLALLFLDLVILPLDSAQSVAATETRLLMAISGGLLVGWGLMMWQVVDKVFVPNPVAGRAILLTGVISWFIIDSLGSVIAGAPFNAVLNVSFLLMFVIPLWKPQTGSIQATA